MLQYFSTLKNSKVALWCYLIWYLVTVFFHFDPSPRIWLNSMGLSVIIGTALLLSVGDLASWKVNKWQTLRLFLMPLCVSSFSSLIKNQGFVLIFPPNIFELGVSTGLCLLFIGFVLMLRQKKGGQAP